MNMKSSQLLELLQNRMEHFCVPGVGVAFFQENKRIGQINLGIEETGTTRKVHSNSIFHACSMSKMVTSLGVLKLVQEGLLELHEDANAYLKS